MSLTKSPVDGAPWLAVEVVSPSNSAQDITKKIKQYLKSGSRSVWVVYPNLRSIEIHSAGGIRNVEAPASLTDEVALPGFSMSLSFVFEGKK